MAVYMCNFILSALGLMNMVRGDFGNVYISVGGMGGGNNDQDINSLKGFCPANTTCVPISSCPILEDLVDYSCVSSDKYFHRLKELVCGNAHNEDYVCCPTYECGRVYQSGADQCGQSMVKGVNYKGIGTHPWVARIGFPHEKTGNVRFLCSGSIINKRVILTAAHCALAKPERPIVVVGEWDIARSPDCNDMFCAPATQVIKVDRMIIHPEYEQKVFRHDIALVVLKEDIKYSVTAAPICLSDELEITVNERAVLVGWGNLSGQNNLVTCQQQLDVPVVSFQRCDQIFSSSLPISVGQLCAGGEAGRDACSGFSGAPLTVYRDGHFVQIGIMSFGSKNCGGKGIPSVYTDVAYYYEWITGSAPTAL